MSELKKSVPEILKENIGVLLTRMLPYIIAILFLFLVVFYSVSQSIKSFNFSESLKWSITITGITLMIILYFYYLSIKSNKKTNIENKVRYTMFCHQCGWKWMSRKTEEGLYPHICPRCRNDNEEELEVVGWSKTKRLDVD